MDYFTGENVTIGPERVFRYIDKDEDGLLNMSECLDALRSCGHKILDRGLAIVGDEFAKLGSDTIDEAQFLILNDKIEQYQAIARDEMRQGLSFFADEGGKASGVDTVKLQTLRHALTTLCDMDPSELDGWFNELKEMPGYVDESGSCKIDDFVQFAMSRPGSSASG